MKTLLRTTALTLAIAAALPAQADQTTLTWNRVALDAVARGKLTQHQVIRLFAHLSLAQYASLANGSSEADTRDAVATASREVIASMVPAQASFVEARMAELGFRDSERGRQHARAVLARAGNDGFAAKWTGELPQTANAWRSLVNPPAPPAYPALSGMRMFLVDSATGFRTTPPPAIGGERFQADLAEVRRYTESPTAETTRIATFYDMTTGTMAGGYWNERAAALMKHHPVAEIRAAAIFATLNAAMMDAIVACHDVKYVHWIPRPSQADPAIKPLIGVPNHPSYPSNHSCISTAAGQVLAHFFPQERRDLEASATDAGLSRIYAGLHYRFDVEAGEEIGREVAAVAANRHSQMLADWSGSASTRSRQAAARVPEKLKPGSHESLAMIVPAKGVQIYECRKAYSTDDRYEWAFVAPEAELLDANGAHIGKHYAGPHWEAHDGSKIVGTLKARVDAPAAGTIPWLLLGAKSVGNAGAFSKVTSIQRVDTVGGATPNAECSRATAGRTERMAYTADYYFYTAR
jgi:hypothetical protein